MSASAAAPRLTRPGSVARGARAQRPAIRLVTFAALSLYGVLRWSTLLHPAPTGRLLGLLALALVIAAAIPEVRRYFGTPAAIGATVVLLLLAFPLSGLPWHYLTHMRIAVSADHIGTGLQGLAGVLVPYLGTSPTIRLVFVLGAAVLLLDAALVLAFAPSPFKDGRRATVALPLVALAVVPTALVRPQQPYLQGLVLFVLLAAFMWCERVRSEALGTAVAVAAVAGIAGALVAPGLDSHKPWVNFRAWAGTVTRPRIDAFDWNQTYGPLHWPHSGHTVLTVAAEHADYWKAENLDVFNGYAWQASTNAVTGALPAPDQAALQKWTQSVRVTIKGMRTTDVIAAGYASEPVIAQNVETGTSAGTWTTSSPLGPGTSYRVLTYSPRPSAGQLRTAGNDYPAPALINYLTLGVPSRQVRAGSLPPVTFPLFHSVAHPAVQHPYVQQFYDPNATSMVLDSPYGGAFRLARRLSVAAPTPYAFVESVQRYLARGFTYNQRPPVRRYPLESFLFKDRIGYCQQFSGAMALLLRMGGVPARVASGFTPGTTDAGGHLWTVSDIDAHAWVEVWFPHYGWVRFDPTPATAPARGGASAAPEAKRVGATSVGASPTVGHGVSHPSSAAGSHHGSTGSGVSLFIVVPGILVLLGLGGVVWFLLRPQPSDDELVAELERALARSGRPLAEDVTLASLEHRFRSSPNAAAYVRALRLKRYGGGAGRPTATERRALRQQLRYGLGLSGRLRSLWALPPRPRSGRVRRHAR